MPVRQWPMTNTGGATSSVRRTRSPWRLSWIHRRAMFPTVTSEAIAAMYQYGGSTANRLPHTSRSQAKKSAPSQSRGDQSRGFLGGAASGIGAGRRGEGSG